MQFILTLFLTLALFYSVEGFVKTCLSCRGHDCDDGNVKILLCPMEEAVCVTATVTVFNESVSPNRIFDIRDCTQACPSPMGVQDEAGWNQRHQRVAATFECCDTDNCNNLPLPLPEPSDLPNGKLCRSCNERLLPGESPLDDTKCVTMFPCQGNEDRCFFQTTVVHIFTIFQRGCVSTNICKNFASFFTNISEGVSGHMGCRPLLPFDPPRFPPMIIQNHAVSFSLSVSSLLLSLIAFAVIH